MQHRRKISDAGQVDFGVYLANSDPVINVPLVNDTAKERTPICLLLFFYVFEYVRTAEEGVELWLGSKPLVEPVKNPLDGLFAERLSARSKQCQIVVRNVEALQ
jgi:hypothetical protein